MNCMGRIAQNTGVEFEGIEEVVTTMKLTKGSSKKGKEYKEEVAM